VWTAGVWKDVSTGQLTVNNTTLRAATTTRNVTLHANTSLHGLDIVTYCTMYIYKLYKPHFRTVIRIVFFSVGVTDTGYLEHSLPVCVF